jgi:hypothetical protein
MQLDRHIAISGGWVAGPAFGVAMMAAPEALGLYHSLAVWLFCGGMAVFVTTLVVVLIASKRERERSHMALWPVLVVGLGLLILGAGFAWYFWPSRPALFAECRRDLLPRETVALEQLITLDLQPTTTWASDRPLTSDKCDLVNDTNNPMINVRFTLKTKFFDVIEEDNGQRESSMSTPERPQPVLIGRIDPGRENAYVFWVINTSNHFANAFFPEFATFETLDDDKTPHVASIRQSNRILGVFALPPFPRPASPSVASPAPPASPQGK